MSDQDFFFDEDEQPKAAEKAPKSAAKKSSAPATPAPAGMPQTVTMTVAVLIGVIGLLAGLVVGILLPIGGTSTATPTVSGTAPTGQAAPQLSEEQMSSGELPPGHPDLGSMGGSGTATESAETPSE